MPRLWKPIFPLIAPGSKIANFADAFKQNSMVFINILFGNVDIKSVKNIMFLTKRFDLI